MELNEIPTMQEVLALAEITDDPVVHIKEALDKSSKANYRFPIGFNEFNQAMNGGLKPGDLYVISGKSGQGKTTYAQTLTYNLCKQGFPCLWFSYEVSLEELDRKFEAAGIADFYYAYTPKLNTTGKLSWIMYKIKEAKTKFKTDIVFIDHIDFLVPSNARQGDSREIALKNITIELKSLAIREKVIIVLLAHLRKLSSDKEPDMEDIGYSGGIYQNADYVVFVMREKIGDATGLAARQYTGETYSNNSIIKYVKNRETGCLKFIKCQFNAGKLLQLDRLQEAPAGMPALFGERG
jgi:replicative DNA helicase